jgi:hypothetical protein
LLHPDHVVVDVGPATVFKRLGCPDLCAIVWHVVEDVEEHGVRETFNLAVRQVFWLAQVVTHRQAEVLLEALVLLNLMREQAFAARRRLAWKLPLLAVVQVHTQRVHAEVCLCYLLLVAHSATIAWCVRISVERVRVEHLRNRRKWTLHTIDQILFRIEVN